MRIAFERVIRDQLRRLVDSELPRQFRRIERHAKRQFDQEYWRRAGDALPE